jgi:methylmalonyl-CoA mutase cobalamin-binding domain/chain
VLIGGTIPDKDVPVLQALGIAQVFPTGTALGAIAPAIEAAVAARRSRLG